MTAHASAKDMGPSSLLDFQTRISEYFNHAHAQNTINHTYLFVGDDGCGIDEMIERLAYWLLCSDDKKIAPEAPITIPASISHKTHPDLLFFEPESARGYVVSQAAQILEAASTPPFSSPCKLIVIRDADALGTSCANALLKTLEEPAASVYFVLVTHAQERVLPTIVSRCQTLIFEAISGEDACAYCMHHTHASTAQAKLALYLTQSPVRACTFLSSPHWMNIRRDIMQFFAHIEEADGWDAVSCVEAIAQELASLSAPVQAELDEEQQRSHEFLPTGEYKKLELSCKRRLARLEREHMLLIFDICAAYMRDIFSCAYGASALINDDDAQRIESLAKKLAPMPGEEGRLRLLALLERVRTCVYEAKQELFATSSSQQALECLLIELCLCMRAGMPS